MELTTIAYPLAIVLAFALGALSFLSPCVLPIVPPYLAYMSGVRMDEIGSGNTRRKMVISACFFVLGLSTVFLLLALAVNRLATQFLQYQIYFNVVAGAVIIIFGLNFLGVLRIPFLEREVRLNANSNASPISAYVLGLAFALGWSPCLGPALSAILSMVAQQGQFLRGMILMEIYAIGLGVPFVLAALLIERFMKSSGWLKRNMNLLKRVMGAVLILVGVLMISGNFSEMSNWLLNTMPFLENIG